MPRKQYTVKVTATRYVDVFAESEEEAEGESLYGKWGWREEGWDDFLAEVHEICDECEDDTDNTDDTDDDNEED